MTTENTEQRNIETLISFYLQENGNHFTQNNNLQENDNHFTQNDITTAAADPKITAEICKTFSNLTAESKNLKSETFLQDFESNKKLVDNLLNNIKPVKFLGKILEPLDFDDSLRIKQKHAEDLLCRYLNMKTVVAFVGSGMSMPLGYPNWQWFAQDIFQLLEVFLTLESSLPRKVKNKDGKPLRDKSGKFLMQEENFLRFLFPGRNKMTAEILAEMLLNEKEPICKIYQSKKKGKKKNIFKEIFKEQKSVEAFLRSLRKLLEPEYNNEDIEKIIEPRYKKLQEHYKEKKNEFDKLLGYVSEEKNNELDFLYIFSECERLLWKGEENLYSNKEDWAENKQSKFFRAIVQSYFQAKRIYAGYKDGIKDEKHNPYLALLKLPIRKFITFNYDLEIERALLHEGRIPLRSIKKEDIYGDDITCKKLIEECAENSFTQKSSDCDGMAKFSIARYAGAKDLIFHAHGRVDDFKSCIVSEEDYQRWYLREEKEKYIPFRQTLDLTLDSNPILFIGFGLKDADLMKVLRTITANRSIANTKNPLFCLLFVGNDDIKKKGGKWKTEQEFEDECRAIYMKYGLHIIPVRKNEYEIKEGVDAIEATCAKLSELQKRWQYWWEGILKKPKFKKFEFGYPHSRYFHYKFKTDEPNEIKNFYNVLLSKIDDSFASNRIDFAPQLAVVIGDGGTGKSWAVQNYLNNPKYKYHKQFYWSSYYGNDVLTGIERLINFFKSELDGTETTKFEKLEKILNKESKKIIVFDGIEKLLNPNKENTEGDSVSPEVTEFFKIISSAKNKCKTIITSRIIPTDIFYNFDELIKNETNPTEKLDLQNRKTKIRKEVIFSAPKCNKNDLSSDNDFPNIFKDNDGDNKKKENFLTVMCSLFEGHIFGISLMKGIITTIQKDTGLTDVEKEEKAHKILRRITNAPIEKRIDRLIAEAIKTSDEYCQKNIWGDSFGESPDEKIVDNFIQRISLFMHPVKPEIAEICLKLSVKPKNLDEEATQSKVFSSKRDNFLSHLVEMNLVQKVKFYDKADKRKSAYVVHPLVRNYVSEGIHKSKFSSFPSLQLPGFTSGKEVVDPGAKYGKQVTVELFEKLCKEAKTIPTNIEEARLRSDKCRAAFSVLRSRFCANTVARWGNYTDYTKMMLNLYDTAKKVSPSYWDYYETENGLENCSEELSPLYPDELSWVYNEVGLASLSLGNNLNATALWDQGYEINKLIDSDKEGRYLFQSNINLGAIYIYYGKLNKAKDFLNKALEIANKLENKNLSHRVSGYIALVKYLRGNLEEADTEFTDACKGLPTNPRARAIFMTWHGELLLKLNRHQDALEKIEQSRHLSDSEYYPDLAAYARLAKANILSSLAKANILLEEQNHIKAQDEYQFVVKYAKDHHLRRLEAATLSGMSRLSDYLGDSSTAVKLAVDSLKISNEHLLSLHQTQGLICLGKALINGNHHEKLGIACLKTARELAQKQEYFLRKNEAEEELAKHNITYPLLHSN